MPVTYDRRAPDALIEVLAPGGWADSLVEYGRAGQYALDLQLRGYAGKSGHWASLYVGLTKAVDLHYRPSKGFHLSAHPTYKQNPRWGWSQDWERPQPGERLAEKWHAVEEYLERVIPGVGPAFLKEGAVQSAISGFSSHEDMVVIDREAVVSFANQGEKRAICAPLERRVLQAMRNDTPPRWWASCPTALGGECDALAVSGDGRLLAIEIKPASATASIRWAPLQARHYANLFSEWIDQCVDAVEILEGMIDQRVRIGLVEAEEATQLRGPLTVHPVIAIGRGWSTSALVGLREVQRRLEDAGLDDPPLEVFAASLTGRLSRIDL